MSRLTYPQYDSYKRPFYDYDKHCEELKKILVIDDDDHAIINHMCDFEKKIFPFKNFDAFMMYCAKNVDFGSNVATANSRFDTIMVILGFALMTGVSARPRRGYNTILANNFSKTVSLNALADHFSASMADLKHKLGLMKFAGNSLPILSNLLVLKSHQVNLVHLYRIVVPDEQTKGPNCVKEYVARSHNFVAIKNEHTIRFLTQSYERNLRQLRRERDDALQGKITVPFDPQTLVTETEELRKSNELLINDLRNKEERIESQRISMERTEIENEVTLKIQKKENEEIRNMLEKTKTELVGYKRRETEHITRQNHYANLEVKNKELQILYDELKQKEELGKYNVRVDQIARDQLNQYVARSKEIEPQLKNLTKENADLKIKISQLVEQNKMLTESMSEMVTVQEKEEEQRKKLRAIDAQEREMMHSTEKEIEKLRRLNKEQQLEITSLKITINNLERENRHLREQLEKQMKASAEKKDDHYDDEKKRKIAPQVLTKDFSNFLADINVSTTIQFHYKQIEILKTHQANVKSNIDNINLEIFKIKELLDIKEFEKRQERERQILEEYSRKADEINVQIKILKELIEETKEKKEKNGNENSNLTKNYPKFRRPNYVLQTVTADQIEEKRKRTIAFFNNSEKAHLLQAFLTKDYLDVKGTKAQNDLMTMEEWQLQRTINSYNRDYLTKPIQRKWVSI